ncbi:MAG: hypothetical protein HYV39_03005 [Candidatus Levybacteria bacterium]|nr:hypothetical protein [Candidatus Levybacteria bacterium]
MINKFFISHLLRSFAWLPKGEARHEPQQARIAPKLYPAKQKLLTEYSESVSEYEIFYGAY